MNAVDLIRKDLKSYKQEFIKDMVLRHRHRIDYLATGEKDKKDEFYDILIQSPEIKDYLMKIKGFMRKLIKEEFPELFFASMSADFCQETGSLEHGVVFHLGFGNVLEKILGMCEQELEGSL